MGFIVDNSFCILFYFIVIVRTYIFKVVLAEDRTTDNSNISTMISHFLLIVIHSVTLSTSFSTFGILKLSESPKSQTKFHDEYYLTIERNRRGLNDGYEVPAVCKPSITMEDIKELPEYQNVSTDQTPRPLSSFKNTTHAEVYATRESVMEFIYEEIQPRVIKYSDSTDESSGIY